MLSTLAAFALAAANAASDWAFGVFPFFIVRGLNLELKTKLLVGGILAFAAIGSTGTVVRMFYIDTLMEGPDFLYATTDVAIVSEFAPGTYKPLSHVLLTSRSGVPSNLA